VYVLSRRLYILSRPSPGPVDGWECSHTHEGHRASNGADVGLDWGVRLTAQTENRPEVDRARQTAHEGNEAGARPERVLRIRRGQRFELPLFLPVYQPHKAASSVTEWRDELRVEGCIVNAYFLYKDRDTRQRFMAGLDLHDYIGFDGLIMTDSGAYQGFNRPLLLANKKIVAFQNTIGADIVSPLDLVTPPGDKRSVAERKLESTLKRIREAKPLCQRGTLAGVQQGGRFRELRCRCVEALMEIGVDYLAIGSLVPFFNRNHNLAFVAEVIRDARRIAGEGMPMHVFGAGDPVELPFLVALGADIFDSSSYGHYAAGGWYMTPYGAVSELEQLEQTGFRCSCAVCGDSVSLESILCDESALRVHNLSTIMSTLRRVREALRMGSLSGLLSDVLSRHSAVFPDSDLGPSWYEANP